jgi:hypothetical protein
VIGYDAFLDAKRIESRPSGFTPDSICPTLFDFQRDIVTWACKRGKAAIFADCGLGKTPMQLEWARLVAEHTGGDVLILAPLAVAQQTRREGVKFGISVTVCRAQSDVRPGVNIANYEMLPHFDAGYFAGIVLDESSILKAHDGKTRNALIDAFASTPYKLACTATPAPNDHMELGNHAEFLGTMSRAEMLAMFFIHDGGDTAKWRLKGHAEQRFWEWVASWAVLMRHPSDLGYDDGAFVLPSLTVDRHVIASEQAPTDTLFAVPAQTLLEQQRARKATIGQRVAEVAALVNADDAPWLIWCDLNDESAALTAAIADAVEVKGADTPEHKESSLLGFSDGDVRVLVTKPSIAGFGMNWQHCSQMAFVGLSHSYEQYYQAIRRCWRFGQEHPVTAHIFVSDLETAVVDNVMRKEADAVRMAEAMVEHTASITSAEIHGTERTVSSYTTDEQSGDRWRMLLGDCVERTREIDSDSLHFSVFSPPFASLYTYSNSERDMGNSRNDAEFAEHFGYLVDDLYRVMMPGRLVAFHCMNLPTSKERDGVIGLRDFRGELIRAFTDRGFIYHSEVCIWKDPVTSMQRTKALGLLHKTIRKDSAMSRQGIADYLVVVRKPGDNPEPISHTADEFPVALWQRYASPVWMDINPSRTLQYRSARENADERHICPLQLDVIERAIELWTNPDDVVFSPFAGIGSEGYSAIKMGRRFVGIELKRSYYDVACRNLEHAEREANSGTLFDQSDD